MAPYDVIGHLIHGERTDWIQRARHILAGERRPFDAFDRTAQFTESQGKSLGELLATWVVHDLDHVAQIVRTMAKGYGAAVGPWTAYLSLLHDRE